MTRVGHPEGAARGAQAFAAVIALAAFAGLALNVYDISGHTASLVATLWVLLDYFTILTNLAIALVFAALALGVPAGRQQRLIAGLTLAILLVGVVNQLLLNGLYNLSPPAVAADVLLHRLTPAMVPVFWLAAVPKGRLTLRDPLVWSLYPVGYFIYAVWRGMLTGHYPYPFMDVGKLGWERTGINAAVIALGFVATGSALVWLDGMLAGRARPRL